MSHLIFMATCLIWGTSFILMKKAGDAFGPVTIAAWRVLGGAAALGLIWVALRRPWPIHRRMLAPLLLVAVVGYAVPFIVQPYLIERSTSGFVGMLVSFVPLLTIIVSVPMLRVYPTRRQVVGVVLGLGFMALLLEDAWRHALSWPQVALAVSIPLSYAIANTYIKRRFAAAPTLALSCAALALAGALLLPLSVVSERVTLDARLPGAVAALLVLGVMCTGVATYLFYRLVQKHGPLYAGMVSYVIPLVAVAWGWLDRERIGVMQVVALAGVLASVALVQAPGRAAEAVRAPG